MKRRMAWVSAVAAVLSISGCTGSDESTDAGGPPSPAPSDDVISSMTFDEAYRKLPMNGTKDLPITWDLSATPNTDEVLAARRSLVFSYWLRSSVDWRPIVPLGRFLYTDEEYQEFIAPSADVTDVDNPLIGPLWVKTVGVEKTGNDQVRVNFCTDTGYWYRKSENRQQVRKFRANLESYFLKRTQVGDADPVWLVDRQRNKAGDLYDRYGAQCTKWARHRP